jgi:hypothetical protein
MPESIKAALAAYSKTAGLMREDRAHLQRWSEDDRADEEWQIIDRAYRALHDHGGASPESLHLGDMQFKRREFITLIGRTAATVPSDNVVVRS